MRDETALGRLLPVATVPAAMTASGVLVEDRVVFLAAVFVTIVATPFAVGVPARLLAVLAIAIEAVTAIVIAPVAPIAPAAMGMTAVRAFVTAVIAMVFCVASVVTTVVAVVIAAPCPVAITMTIATVGVPALPAIAVVAPFDADRHIAVMVAASHVDAAVACEAVRNAIADVAAHFFASVSNICLRHTRQGREACESSG